MARDHCATAVGISVAARDHAYPSISKFELAYEGSHGGGPGHSIFCPRSSALDSVLEKRRVRNRVGEVEDGVAVLSRNLPPMEMSAQSAPLALLVVVSARR
jgi:hypothetical protein